MGCYALLRFCGTKAIKHIALYSHRYIMHGETHCFVLVYSCLVLSWLPALALQHLDFGASSIFCWYHCLPDPETLSDYSFFRTCEYAICVTGLKYLLLSNSKKILICNENCK